MVAINDGEENWEEGVVARKRRCRVQGAAARNLKFGSGGVSELSGISGLVGCGGFWWFSKFEFRDYVWLL